MRIERRTFHHHFSDVRYGDSDQYGVAPDAVETLAKEGATPATSVAEFVSSLTVPRVVCLMVPAGVVDSSIAELLPLLSEGDTVVDGGNSHYQDSARRAAHLADSKQHF